MPSPGTSARLARVCLSARSAQGQCSVALRGTADGSVLLPLFAIGRAPRRRIAADSHRQRAAKFQAARCRCASGPQSAPSAMQRRLELSAVERRVELRAVRDLAQFGTRRPLEVSAVRTSAQLRTQKTKRKAVIGTAIGAGQGGAGIYPIVGRARAVSTERKESRYAHAR